MKRLLLLLILSPVILFGQTRRTAIVDSIKAAATNLRDVSTLISKYPDAKVEHTHISDSDDYVTIVVRIHVADAGVIPTIPMLPVMKLKTADIVFAGLSPVTVPPLPPPVIEAYEITALTPLAVAQLRTENITFPKMHSVTVPPLPDIRPELIADLPVAGITQFKTEDIAVLKVNTVPLPPLPGVRPELIADLPWIGIAPFKMDHIGATRMDTVHIPKFDWVTLEAFPLPAAVTLAIEKVTFGKMDTVEVPGFEEKKMPVAEMHLSDEGYSLLEKMEGFSPKLYSLKDGGFTIGFGFFVPYAEGRNWDKGVTLEAAELIMKQKVPAYEDQVKQYVNVQLTQEEFDALTLMAYNLGGFSKATSIVNDINSNADFEQLQKDWMRFVHSKAPGVMKGLMNRRKDELQVRNESDYQRERKIQFLNTGK